MLQFNMWSLIFDISRILLDWMLLTLLKSTLYYLYYIQIFLNGVCSFWTITQTNVWILYFWRGPALQVFLCKKWCKKEEKFKSRKVSSSFSSHLCSASPLLLDSLSRKSWKYLISLKWVFLRNDTLVFVHLDTSTSLCPLAKLSPGKFYLHHFKIHLYIKAGVDCQQWWSNYLCK